MLEYNRIDISEGIDVNKTSNSREFSLCKFYYFLNYFLNFNYQMYLCDGCHDMSGNAYRVNFVFMSKNDAFNIIKNSNIIDKKGVL